VRHWIKEGMPVTPQNKYDLIEIRSWRLLRDKRKKSSGQKKDNAEFWETKYREYKARLAETEYKKRIGKLVDKEEIFAEFDIIHSGIKQRLLILSRQLAPALVGLDARQIDQLIDLRIKEAIKDIYDAKVFKEEIDVKLKKN
jgi:hypothetical protein